MPDTSTPRAEPSLNRITQNSLAVPLRAKLRNPSLRFEVNIIKSESLAVSICPLKVIHQTPEKITLNRVPFGSCAMEMREVVSQIHHAVCILNPPVGSHYIIG